MQFKLTSEFQPTGDQPEAIRQLIQGLQSGRSSQVLLGVTGSGKTFTVANVINEIHRPTLILSHNKTLAGSIIRGIQIFFPRKCSRIFCILLRLLPTGSLSADNRYLYRKRPRHQ